MKHLLSLFLFFMAINFCQAQNPPLNCTRYSQLPYSVRLSNIWGYAAPNGKEYALVGTFNGNSIVDVSNPSTPAEVEFIPGGNTIWRELKTWDKYMYVVSEQVNEGLLIADLSTVGNNFSYQFKYLAVGTDTVRNAHTLYIDEKGYLYLAGTNLANGAPLIFNLNPDPQNPVYVGTVGNVYAHDMYARNDTLWGSHIFAGQFSVYDITNRANPQLLALQNTSSNFTHNAWLSDDSKYLFTTDERSAAFVDAYDVSDLTNIKLLDKWKYPVTGESAPIPHNAHVLNDYVVVSYYTEGIVILDGKNPDNLVEIAHYDTYPPFGNGFAGCWGVYPYLPSGIVLASDINTGLHVLQPDYRRACLLEGNVTSSNGFPLNNVLVEIVNTNASEITPLSGDYKTGHHTSGTYQVRFRKTGYLPETRTVQLFNDSTIILNVSLMNAITLNTGGSVVEADQPTLGIENAFVRYEHSAGFYDYNTQCNNSGNYSLNVYEEEYFLQAGKWGYQTSQVTNYINAQSNPILTLDTAIYDDFTFDFGWTVGGTIDSGAWEIAVPNSVYEWSGMMPKTDLLNDIGHQAFISGITQSRSDAGYSVLTSPKFDGTKFSDPHLGFHYWFSAFDSTYAVSYDSLQVWVSNGNNQVNITNYFTGLYNWSDNQIFRLQDFITLSDSMQVSFKYTNRNSRNYIEAAIDKFRVAELNTLTNVDNTANILENNLSLRAFPNPFKESIVVESEILNRDINKSDILLVYNVYGQLIEQIQLQNVSEKLEIGKYWPNGVYFINLHNQNIKVLKQ